METSKEDHFEVELNADDVDVTAEDMAALEAVGYVPLFSLSLFLSLPSFCLS